MSRGLGKVQRAILARLERQGYVLPRDVEGFAQPSVSRAVNSLADRGLVDVWYINVKTECVYPDWVTGEPKKKESLRRCAVVVPPGTDREALRELRERRGLLPR